MEGEDGEEPSDNPHAFPNAVWWKKTIILAAGAFMNFVVGVLLMLAFFAPDKQFIMPVVSEVDPRCSFAGEAGIQAGDRLWSIDGERIYVSSDFSMLLSLKGGETHDLVVVRGGKRVSLPNLDLRKQDFENEDGTVTQRYGFSFTLCNASPGVTLGGSKFITDRLMAMKSVMNLLPIPALDGGRVVGVLLSAAYEGITKKKPNPKIEGYIHGAGMVLLMALMVLLLFKDIIFAIKG